MNSGRRAIMTIPMRLVGATFADTRYLLALILCFALAARAYMAVTVPPWQGPDEPKHFEHIRMLVDKRAQLWDERRLLKISDGLPEFQGKVIASMANYHFWQYWDREVPAVLPSTFHEVWKGMGTQLHRPSLYYFASAAGLLPFQGAGLEEQLFAVRLLSAVLSTLTVAVTYLVGRELMPKDRFVAVAGAAFVATLPMHVFMGGTVNSDNMVTLWGALMALAMTIGIRRGFTVGRMALLFGALALAILTKRTAVGLAPVALVAVPLWLLSLPRRVLLFAGAGLALTGGLVALGAGNGWTRGIVDLDGLRKMAMAYALNEADQFERLLAVPITSAKTEDLIAGHLTWLFRSFWGVFGWFNVPLSMELYGLIALATAACALGFFVWLAFQIGAQIRHPDETRGNRILVLVVFLLALVSMVALAVGERLAYFSPGEIPQGRYLFAAVAPAAVLYAVGARALMPQRLLGTRAPLSLFLLALVLLDLVVLTRHILPFYVWRVFA